MLISIKVNMNKILLTLLLSIVGAQAQFWMGGNSAGGGAPAVTIVAPGAGLKAILEASANDKTYQLGVGTYTVTPSILQSNLAAGNTFTGITLANKTNVTLLGVPGSSIIDGSVAPGQQLWISNCSGIKIIGVTFIGYTNHASQTFPFNSSFIWSSVDLLRCENVLFENCRIERQADHGLTDKGAEADGGVASSPPSTNQMVVRNCYFENIGGFRSGALATDGTAIVPTGWTIENCEFRNCLRGIEPYESPGALGQIINNCVIRGNRFYNMVEFAVSTAGATNIHNAIVENNYIRNDYTFSYHGTNFGPGFYESICVGYNFNGGRGWLVRNNVARGGMSAGFQFLNSLSFLDDFIVIGNSTIDIDRGSGSVGVGFTIGDSANSAAAASSVRRMMFRENTAINAGSVGYGGFRILGCRDSTFDNNIAIKSHVYTAVDVANSAFNVGVAGNSAAFITNLVMRNNLAIDGGIGTPYGFVLQDNIRNAVFENNDARDYGANGGFTNRSGANVSILGPVKNYSASVDFPSIAGNGVSDIVITAVGVTTNDVITYSLPSQFWGNPSDKVVFAAWATNSTATDGQIVFRAINNDVAVATVNFAATTVQFQARAVRFHGQ
jgi:hypothetical protein